MSPKKPTAPIPMPKTPSRRHGGTLRVELPVMGESTLRERAELCLRALAISEGVHGCDGGAGDEPCMFPACLASGCPGGERE